MMKKKLWGSLVALVFVLMTGVCLTACGGDSKKLKINVEQFDDDGIVAVGIYAAKADEYNKDDENSMSAFHFSGNCYSSYGDGYQTVKLNEGTYAGVVVLQLNESHTLGGGWMSGYDVKAEVNGTQLEFLPTSLFQGSNPFGGYDYWALIGDDGVFSDDLNLKLVGKTTIKTYAPTLTIKNYDETSDSYSKYENLVFKVSKDGKTLTNAGKQEFNVNELKVLLDEQTYTYYDKYDVVGYFKNKDRFFPNNSNIWEFTNSAVSVSGDNNDLEFFWHHSYDNYTNKIELDFAAFDNFTLDDMTKVKFARGSAGEMFNTMFQSENIKFVVDGTEKTELTMADYYHANSLKIKSIVSDLGVKVLQDTNMTVTPVPASNYYEDQQPKKLTQSEIIIGGAVDGKPGYREVTFDLGNYKAYKRNASEFTAISLNIFTKGDADGHGGFLSKPYTDAMLKTLNKVEFESDQSDDGAKLSNWYDNENQIDSYTPDWELDGCYYMSDKPLEIRIGRTSFGGEGITATLKLTITRKDGSYEEVNLTFSQDHWVLEENDYVKCEVVYTENWGNIHKVTINDGDIAKVKTEMTGPNY